MNSIPRILVVNDDPVILFGTARVLQKAGYEVFQAASGLEGLRQTHETWPDLILLDVSMPDMDGFEVCQRIKSDPAFQSILVVLLSGTVINSEKQAEGLDLGADGYIVYPVSPLELLARVRAFLRLKKAEDALRQHAGHLEEMVAARTQELRAVQEQLMRREKLALLGQISGSIAHELRGPLASISNAIYYLKMILPPDQNTLEYLQIINAEIHKSEQIISGLLSFTKTANIDRQPVVVFELVNAALENNPVPDGISMTRHIPDDLKRVYIDPQQISLVLDNLITNAYQAMPQGGKMTISAIPHDKAVNLVIADTGSGITPENLIKIFEPLFTTKKNGIGLGLSLSKMLVEANSGAITVESEANQCSSFTLTLPFEVRGLPTEDAL
jgi:signal transduction histidine kinase